MLIHTIISVISICEVDIVEIENTGIEDTLIDVQPLNHLMGTNGFIKGEHWDYERITYDYKIGSHEKGVSYYVRIQGYAVEGDIDRGDAVVKLLTPLLGKHYYPHGVEYGEEENFPKNLVDRAFDLVTKANEAIEMYRK